MRQVAVVPNNIIGLFKNIITIFNVGALKLNGNSSMKAIATHGLYWTEQEAKFRTDLDFLMLGRDKTNSSEDKALSRSGLLFAGANNVLSGKKLPENVDDGILTAKEISTLNLQNFDLVVLSACQTGHVEIIGDGVFGLQRGFKKAGVRSLLMSLWKVDYAATQILMAEFYKNLVKGMNKHESLKQAQNFLKEYEVEVVSINDSHPSLSAHAKGKKGGKHYS